MRSPTRVTSERTRISRKFIWAGRPERTEFKAESCGQENAQNEMETNEDAMAALEAEILQQDKELEELIQQVQLLQGKNEVAVKEVRRSM